MPKPKRTFETRGPVDPDRNYVVPRTVEIADFVERIKHGRYAVIFAPRQTGKTTFFRWALDALVAEDDTYFPIQLDFETYRNISIEAFYTELQRDIRDEIRMEYERREMMMDSEFEQFLENYPLRDHLQFQPFLEQLGAYLGKKVAIIIDEFDGIPQAVLSDFLYTLRRIYLSREENRCPYSLGIVGVKSITQLNYDRSISPFNIQDDFNLSNFTLPQIQRLLGQYTEDTGQAFAPEVVESIHRQTDGQPFLVNRMAQILTQEMSIPLEDTISVAHFEMAHQHILDEDSVHLAHLTTNIRRDARFERLLLRICLKESGIRFNIRNDLISELATYGVLKKGADGFCKVLNPIYQYVIVQTFLPLINGLEDEYLPEDSDLDFSDYVTAAGKINLRGALANFRGFIARVGYRILEVPESPKEFVATYLLYSYLDYLVREIGGYMYPEVPTGRGRMDLMILYRGEKYIIEIKIWGGQKRYQAGKHQLARYLDLEQVEEGYYLVFDHRRKPQAREGEERIDGKTIVSFCIPVPQERPSQQGVPPPYSRRP